MRFIWKTISFFVKLAFVITVNFLLFILIPLTHNLFGKINETKKDELSNQKIIAEIVRPPKQDEKKLIQPRIRNVNSSSSHRGQTNRMNFKFTPDLGIGGGDGVAIEQQGNMEAVVFEEGEVDEKAIPIYNPYPEYPSRARELGIEGILEVNLTVGIDGKVVKINIISSPHSSITTQARKVFNKWRFKPARNKGIPVLMKLKQVIEYKLDS